MVNKKTGKAGKGLPTWLKATLIVMALLVAIVVALPFVVPLNIEGGEIGNFDLVRAVRAPAKEGIRGGRTKFDVFSGAMTYGNRETKLNQLQVGSGLLSAEGNIHIQADKEMGGSANVVVRSSANSFRSKLRIAGSLDSPVLIPN
jgi:hypothetical protein